MRAQKGRCAALPSSRLHTLACVPPTPQLVGACIAARAAVVPGRRDGGEEVGVHVDVSVLGTLASAGIPIGWREKVACMPEVIRLAETLVRKKVVSRP